MKFLPLEFFAFFMIAAICCGVSNYISDSHTSGWIAGSIYVTIFMAYRWAKKEQDDERPDSAED